MRGELLTFGLAVDVSQRGNDKCGLHVSIAVFPRSCQLDIDSMTVGWAAMNSCALHECDANVLG
jgi:hypothetical protein